MSESTITQGTNGTMDQEQLAAFLAWQQKEADRKAKLAAAAEQRKRANDRGKMADGTDRNATQAFLASAAELLDNWASAYAQDPDQLVRRIREQLIPALNAVANTPSTTMAGAQDQFRHLMRGYHAPAKASTPAPTGKGDAK